MVDGHDQRLLGEDATGVGLQLVGGHDAATDWTSSEDFLLHGVRTLDHTELADSPLFEGLNSPAVIGSWSAVHAVLFRTAAEMLRIQSLVDLATHLWDSSSVGEQIRSVSVSSVARTSSIAVDDGLHSQTDSREDVVSHDVDSVADARGTSLGPAGAAVLRQMLVDGPGEIVDSVDITPPEVLGDGHRHFRRLRRSDHLERHLVAVSGLVAVSVQSWLL